MISSSSARRSSASRGLSERSPLATPASSGARRTRSSSEITSIILSSLSGDRSPTRDESSCLALTCSPASSSPTIHQPCCLRPPGRRAPFRPAGAAAATLPSGMAIDTRTDGRETRAPPERSGARASGHARYACPFVELTHLTPPPAAPRGAGEDVQARPPLVPVGLSRVGVTGVEKVVRIGDELYFARLDCYVDLSHTQKGAHMSRFDEVVNEAIGEVVLGESPFRAETLAQHIAELVRSRQRAERAEVTIAARYPEHKPAPASGVQTQEIYTLYGRAVAFEHGPRRT